MRIRSTRDNSDATLRISRQAKGRGGPGDPASDDEYLSFCQGLLPDGDHSFYGLRRLDPDLLRDLNHILRLLQ